MPASTTRDQDRLDFDRVYAEFRPKIRRYLDRLAGPTDADDLTQDVFSRISQALARFRGDSSLSTWIYRIATNAAYDRLRARASRAESDALEPDAPIADPSSDVAQKLVRRQMNDCIGEYIARLPVSYRSVVILSEHEGLTNVEIAEALGVTLDTVKIRLHRARARLKKELGGGCDFYRDDRNEFACEPKRVSVSPKE